jgi:Protein of unknown function (DUF3800)
MHLLYLDDAGSVGNSKEEYVVLGGISLFEPQVNWVTQQLDKLAESVDANNPQGVEFHASEIFSRRSAPWDKMTADESRGIIKAVLKVAANSYETARTFACAVHKKSYPGSDPMELAFEDLCSRFDLYLTRVQAAGDRQRGLLILDESAYETSLQKLALNFRRLGTRWGSSIRHLAEAPLFIDSRVSRAVQLADHVAYAVFRRYNAGDTNYFDIIASKFDMADGVIHGLTHKQNVDLNCMCPACMSRRKTSP